MMPRLASHLERYPAVAALAVLVAGIFTANTSRTCLGTWSLVPVLISLFMLLGSLRVRQREYLWLSTAAFLCSFGFYSAMAGLCIGEAFSPPADKRVIHATVRDKLASGDQFRILLLDSGRDTVANQPIPGFGRLFLRENETPLRAGDRVSFRSGIKKPRNRGNPGEFDWETYCKDNGILWQASVQGPHSVLLLSRGSRLAPRAALYELREAMSNFLERHSQGDVRAVLKGIVLGDQGEVDSSLRRSFATSGLAHILSASGLHVGIVALFTSIFVLIATAPYPTVFLWTPRRKLAAAASVPAMVIYCLLVGGRAPAVRSTIMGLVVAAAIMLDRRWYSLNSLALAAFIILLVYPLSIFTVSFQLSFAAVLGILLVVPNVIRRWYGPPQGDLQSAATEPDMRAGRNERWTTKFSRHAAALCLTSFAATLATAPFLAQTFHYFPVYTLPANLIAVPLFTIALPVALFAAVLGIIWPAAGALMLEPAALLVDVSIRAGRFFAELPASTVTLPELRVPEFIIAVGAIFGVLWCFGWPTRKRWVAVVTVGLVLAALAAALRWLGPEEPPFRVIFLNVGKADAALVTAWPGDTLLIDGGVKNPHFDSGESILLPFFQWAGIRGPQEIVLTHPQMDHMGGLAAVISRSPPMRLWHNRIGFEPTFLTDLLAAVQAGGGAVEQADRSAQSIMMGNAQVTFLNPPAPILGQHCLSRDVNNASVVCRIDYGKVSFLFSGDLEGAGEEELLTSGQILEATVLKVAHHGCKTSTTEQFLRAVRPKIAVIPCEERQQAACPNPDVLRRLEDVAMHVFWTGRDGAVTLETDGQTLSFRTGRARRGIVQP
ncbi:MAG: DNA internalization-related competence protein ComEC/Rec2 [Thermodesulfobacteriota bacterium]